MLYVMVVDACIMYVCACRPALLASAEKFTVLIKNNIRFPAFNFIR